jgi:putative transposase
LRYVERNALRAKLAERAEAWPWSSLVPWLNPPEWPWLDAGPVPRPACWLEHVQAPHTEAELAALRRSIERNAPYGSAEWMKQTVQKLGLQGQLQLNRCARSDFQQEIVAPTATASLHHGALLLVRVLFQE